MALFQKRDKFADKMISDMSDKQRKAKTDRLEESRDDVVRRIEKLMVRISRKTRMRRKRNRKYSLGDSPNDRDPE